MAGDSTMADVLLPHPDPRSGWGQAFAKLFPEGVVDNRALGGRSTLSFLTQGHWNRLVDDINVGDWVIIQFGHNDQKDADPTRFTKPKGAYRENLVHFVNDVRDRGGLPILATSITRRHFDENNVLLDSHGEYLTVTREIATRLDVPLLDLQHVTAHLILEHGVEESKKMYAWIEKGLYKSLPDGAQDNTHLTHYGAELIAQGALREARRLELGLVKLLAIS